jgi:hypothetical protein
MSKLKSLTIPDHHKEEAKRTLNDAIDEEPDTVIVLCFWKDRGEFKIKCSTVPDRLQLLGALREAEAHVIERGYRA